MASPRFGRYEQLFRIAAGGMAEVYAARMQGEAGFQKLVAVKRMLPHLAEDPQFVSMFLDEARLAANIASPHVVSTLDLGRTEDGSLYIVMELVVGAPLSALMAVARRDHRELPIAVVAELLAQAALGLEDAHDARTPTGQPMHLVHRDVSPQNILVGADGRVRVMDFGVARALSRQTRSATGTLKGKFGYFSPEQARGRDIDRRSDVFALGIVAWEALLSRRLFEGETPHEQLRRVQSEPITTPASIRRDLPDAVSVAVMRALERDPDARWQTAADFARALRAACGTSLTGRELAALLDELAGESVRDMQARIETALATGGATGELAIAEPAPHTRTMDLSAGARCDEPTLLLAGEAPTIASPAVFEQDTVIHARQTTGEDAIATVAHRTRVQVTREERARRSAWLVGLTAALLTLVTLAALAASSRAPAPAPAAATAPELATVAAPPEPVVIDDQGPPSAGAEPAAASGPTSAEAPTREPVRASPPGEIRAPAGAPTRRRRGRSLGTSPSRTGLLGDRAFDEGL